MGLGVILEAACPPPPSSPPAPPPPPPLPLPGPFPPLVAGATCGGKPGEEGGVDGSPRVGGVPPSRVRSRSQIYLASNGVLSNGYLARVVQWFCKATFAVNSLVFGQLSNFH